MSILDAVGNDITRDVTDAAISAGIPPLLLLGCAIAESGLNPRAERWGKSTADAQAAMVAQNWDRLQAIIDVTWPDCSFGYMQHIVKFHYLGDRTQSVENCLNVRGQVFENPLGNLMNGALRLANYLRTAHQQDLTPVDGDELLMACVIFNAGHVPVDAAEWQDRAPRVQHYRESLNRAAAMLAETSGEIDEKNSKEDSEMTIEEKAQQMTADGDRLGNDGQPYSPVCEWETSAGLMRFQQFWLGNLIEYPTLDGNRDVATYPEGTLTAEDLARFQGRPA